MIFFRNIKTVSIETPLDIGNCVTSALHFEAENGGTYLVDLFFPTMDAAKLFVANANAADIYADDPKSRDVCLSKYDVVQVTFEKPTSSDGWRVEFRMSDHSTDTIIAYKERATP